MTSYCQYTPDKKEQSTQNQTKICAIIVFYVYFVLYIELLFGDVGLNGSLNSKFQIINPDGITKNFYYEKSIGEVGGWFRFFKITYFSETVAQGATYNHFNVTISQVFNNGLGGNCNFDIIEEYEDNPYIIQRYNTLKQIKKFRIVRSGNIIYFDFYANSINNTTIVLINIPFYKNTSNISEASIVKYLIVPDVSDGEKIIKNTNLTTNN